MSPKSPLDKILETAFERVASLIRCYHDDNHHDHDSPIERIMMAAIYAEIVFGVGTHSFDRAVYVINDSGQPPSLDTRGCLNIEFQAPVGRYRADFIVHAYEPIAGEWKHLVVECDGHDFHERTKQQAAHDRSRDRTMQERGLTVFRFTGSEIYRDPVKCAQQVVAWADKVTFG